eukprot:TRINITY_DN20870_c0_g1_i1.p1 TRINITY_DN20870_c0_g1~~TRINITY_DN20870_c0_g1_i1.p1  ORF type:complete len:178 (+),score=57.74 TRINITY_DN20870_c0_g1_i1:70-603(+)
MASQLDFRRLDEGLGGHGLSGKKGKRKRDDEMEVEVEAEGPGTAKRSAVMMDEDSTKPSYGKPTYDGTIAGKVSGRRWKAVKSERTSAMKVSLRRTTVAQRNSERELKKAYKQRMSELKEEIRSNKQAKRQQIAERKRIKAENELKGMVVQKISNAKTLKKMMKSKKQRKLLMKAPG